MEKRRKNLIIFIIALIILMLVFIDDNTSDWTENLGNYLGIFTGIILVGSLLFTNASSKKG